MAEYIKKEALMFALCKEITGDGDYYNGKDDMQDEIRDMVSRFPAANVAPVRHGRWEWCKDYDGDSILVCSECGRVCHEEDAPYCYCGAKMDGGFDNG